MAEQQFPEPAVGALIFDRERRLLLVRSHKWYDKYVVPGGHIELGERMEQALRREVLEETGLEIYDVEFLCFQEFVFDEAFWKRGHYIFFDYICKTDRQDVCLNDEAQAYVWVSPAQALAMPLDSYTRVALNEYLKRQAS